MAKAIPVPPVPPIVDDDDDDDPPEPIPQPIRKPNEERRAHQAPKSITCEFCECSVTTMEGAIVKMSKRARELREASELIDSLRAKISEHEATITELKAKVTPPTPVPEKKKNWWD